MYKDILFETRENDVGVLTLNKEKSLNVLGRETILELEKLAGERFGGGNLKALVVTGAGSKAFAAGADVKQMRDMSGKEFKAYCEAAYGFFGCLGSAPFPVIAAVNGYALGGGFELALACDFRIAASSARVGFPETRLGLFPCWGGSTRAALLAGQSKTKELVFTGEMITASEALEAGLVDRVVEPEKLMEEVMKTAGQIAKNAPLAISYAKEVINGVRGEELSRGLARELETGLRCFDSQDRVEGMGAFVEKRDARFEGK